MEPNYQVIGRNIKVYRKRAGLTQEVLAEKVGRSTAHVSNIECGKVGLSLELLYKFAAVLGVTLDQLAGMKVSRPEQAPDSFSDVLEAMLGELGPEESEICRAACLDFCEAFSKRFNRNQNA